MANLRKAPPDVETEYKASEYQQDTNIESQEIKQSSGSGASAAIRGFSLFLLIAAFVLMGLAALTPIMKTIFLFSLKVEVNALIDKASETFNFGVWGYCSSGDNNSFLGIKSSITKTKCSDKKLGWTFKDIPGVSDDTQDAISEGLTGVFVLHVVAAILIIPAIGATVFGMVKPDAYVRGQLITEPVRDEDGEEIEDEEHYAEPTEDDISYGHRRLAGTVAAASFFSFILVLVVFVIDVAGLLVTKSKVHSKSKGVAELTLGNAFWFVVASFACMLLVLILAILDAVAIAGKTSTEVEDDEDDEVDNDEYEKNGRSKDQAPPRTGDSESAYSEGGMVDVSLSEEPRRRR